MAKDQPAHASTLCEGSFEREFFCPYDCPTAKRLRKKGTASSLSLSALANLNPDSNSQQLSGHPSAQGKSITQCRPPLGPAGRPG
jgi:hypothetical protein